MADVPAENRLRLRATFNAAAEKYHRARPAYPAQLFNDLIALTHLSETSRLLEVGCGTGKATSPLAERGFKINCLELGADLARAATRNLASFPSVHVINQSFEEWKPPADIVFDLVYAATAWHWIDPEVRYRKAHQVMGPDGHLAFWDAVHVFPDAGDHFFRELQPVYDEIGEGVGSDHVWPTPDQLQDSREEILATGLFTDVVVRLYDWELEYDSESYIDLLNTFSGHIAMADWKRERLYGEIRRRLAERPSGRLRRHWGVVLNVARKIS